MLVRALICGIVFVACSTLAHAECRIWAIEDTSVTAQDRARIFAWSDLTDRDALVAEAAGIARRIADDGNLDFVDVFLTQPQDGTDRSFHMSMTTTVWMRYNPGQTPVIDGRMEASALDAGADVKLEYGVLSGVRSELDAAAIEAIEASQPAGVSDACSQ